MSKEKHEKWDSTTGLARGVQTVSTLTHKMLRCTDKSKRNEESLVIFLRKQVLHTETRIIKN